MSLPTEQRLAALRTRMVESKTDLVILGPGPHMAWLLGFHPHPDERPCLLIVGQKQEILMIPALNAEDAREKTAIAFHEWTDDQGPTSALTKALENIGVSEVQSIVLDETMRADFALPVLDVFPNSKRRFTADTVGALRMRKDESEYQRLKENALINDRAMQAGLAVIRPGISENQIADVIRTHYPHEGAKPRFWIIGSGPNSAFPHHATGERMVQAGDAIVIDIGGSKGNFFSDLTRMAVVEYPPEGYSDVHEIVEMAVQAAMKAVKTGVVTKDVDLAARDVIFKAGYGDYFVHRTGHGIGMDVHEPPYLTSVSETVLEKGMVFSIEPGIYLPGRFGIRLEEIVILRDDGPEILSELPRNVVIVGK